MCCDGWPVPTSARGASFAGWPARVGIPGALVPVLCHAGAVPQRRDKPGQPGDLRRRQAGHFGGAGPWVNLQEAEKTNRIQSGDIIGVYAQGAGFTRAAAIIEW